MNYVWQWWQVYTDTGEVALLGIHTELSPSTVRVIQEEDWSHDTEWKSEREVMYIWVGARWMDGMCCYSDVNEMVSDMEKFDNVKF